MSSQTVNISLTEIFPPAILPVRSGVYRTRPRDPETGELASEDWGFSYFDATDRVWGCVHGTVDQAWQAPEYEFAHQCKEWQGVTEEVKP